MKAFSIALVLTLLTLGLLPFAIIAKSRASQKDARPLHLVMDMDKQDKFKAQRGTTMFADGRSMRPHIEGTVAQEDMWIFAQTLNGVEGTRPVGLAGGNNSLLLGDASTAAAVLQGRIRPAAMTDEAFDNLKSPNKTDADINADNFFYVRRIPAAFAVSSDFLKRGHERFVIYCAPCHGESGYGDGPVGGHVTTLQKKSSDSVNGWVAPQNLHEDKILRRPDGHLFNTITEGIRNMPAYDKQISIEDRWAIIAYIRALQLSQNATPPGPQ